MADNNNVDAPVTEVTEVETPVTDPILSELSDETQPADAEVKPAETAATEETPEDKPEEPESEPKPEGEPEDKKDEEPLDSKEEARRRYEERRATQAERAQRVVEQNKPYIDEATDDTDRRVRTMEVAEYNRIIENNENTLVNEFERVKANPELQIFNPDNKDEFNPALYNKVIKDYNAGYLAYDEQGNMIGVKGSLYQYLTETAEIYQGAVKSGQFKQVRDTRQNKGKADAKPAATPKDDSVKDPIMEVLQSD